MAWGIPDKSRHQALHVQISDHGLGRIYSLHYPRTIGESVFPNLVYTYRIDKLLSNHCHPIRTILHL